MKIWILNPPYLKKYSRPQRSPAVTKSGTIYFPIWLSFCAGVLEQAGHDITFTDAPARGYDLNHILRLAKELSPALVVMDTSTPSIENDISVCDKIKDTLPEAYTVLVGTHVSALPEETLKTSKKIDAIARREYEYTIKELADFLGSRKGSSIDVEGLKKINGLSFQSNQGCVHNPDRPFIEDLDALPWVSRVYQKHLRIGDYFNPNAPYPMVTLITSRGCPFRCNFCVYPQVFTGRRFRFRSVTDVVDEMEFVARAFPEAKSIFFEDDTLTANRSRCMAFAEAIIERGLKIPWVANSRIDLDFKTLERIKASGCRELCVGFESGNDKALSAMNKGVKVEQMFRFMEDARKAGIFIHGCFIFGFPGETLDDIEKTIDLAIRLNPDTVQFYPVMVYPGTEAFEEYRQKGLLTKRSYRDWLTPDGLHNCVVRNETLSSEDLVRLCDLARRRFYLRPGYIAYKLKQMVTKPAEIGRTIKAARTFMKHLVFGSRV